MKLTDKLRYALAVALVVAAIGVTVYLWVNAPALAYDNCDMRVFAGRVIICH